LGLATEKPIHANISTESKRFKIASCKAYNKKTETLTTTFNKCDRVEAYKGL